MTERSAKLPGLQPPKVSDPALARWVQGVTEHLEVRNAGRGDPKDRAVTFRDLEGQGSAVLSRPFSMEQITRHVVSSPMVQGMLDDNLRRFERDVVSSSAFKALNSKVSDLSVALQGTFQGQQAFYELQESTAQALAAVKSLEAARLGYCTINGETTDHSNRSACELAGGTWHPDLPFATAVKQVKVSDGANAVTLEQRFTAQKNLNNTLSGEYTLKLNANGVVAGIGLAADVNGVTGQASTALVFQADKFALVPPSYTGSTSDPDVSVVPFGVDTTGPTPQLFINGVLRVRSDDGNSITIGQMAANSLSPALNYVGEFATAPTQASLGAQWRQNTLYKNTTDGKSYILTGNPLAWVAYIADGNSFNLVVESTNGTTFRIGQNTSTQLKARLFRNGAEITDQTPDSWFRWRRVSFINRLPPNDDASWNSLYANGGYKVITINVDDVFARATFFCDVVST